MRHAITFVSLLFTILSCELPTAAVEPADPRIPVECTDPVAAVYHKGPPPADARIAAGWLQAVHLADQPGDSTVETAWIQFYWKRGTGVWELRETLTFQGQSWSTWDGALYYRYPWFGGNDFHEAMPQVSTQGTLVMRPSLRKDRVWHWWNKDRTALPSDVRGTKMVVRIRSTGAAVFQIVLDYRKPADGQSSYEAAVSSWYGSSDGWVTVTVTSE